MDDMAQDAAGGAFASMLLHQVTFTVMLRHGFVAPQQVRELLDQAMLLVAETLPGLAGETARTRLEALLAALEATCPEMILTNWRAAPGGPDA